MTALDIDACFENVMQLVDQAGEVKGGNCLNLRYPTVDVTFIIHISIF